ncbi:MAG: carboxypeptidase-like regulatory domain-containing protein [Bacteroidota bacterium]|nr:carboxypeptidase-like regulatory domain-containing protein [Bacteroidota bacterium]
MKIVPAILFFMTLPFTGSSQRTIKGRVVNAATGTAVPGSSVFIANTSKGTVSNSAGTFELNDVPAGKHELIISSIGYETNVFSFHDEQLPLQLKIELTIKVKELENVTVEPSLEEGWDKWGRVFMENFVGKTANGDQCRIKNEKAIRFRYFKKSKRLIAYCDEPLLLENKALGYVIKYQLEDFEMNFEEKTIFFLGYSFFEPISNEGKGRQQKWEKKREEAYNGSILHFMRSVYTNRLLEEGFNVRRMKKNFNAEKQRVKNLYRTSRLVRSGTLNGVIIEEVNNDPALFPRDSINYYESVMRQEDYVETYGHDLLSADSLVIDSTETLRVLHFNEYLFITYTKEKEEDEYVRLQFPERKASFQRSSVTLLGNQLISFEQNGNYFDPRNFFTSGYWGWGEKMANSLPLEYTLGK